VRRFLLIIFLFLFTLFDFLLDVGAEDICSHSIRIKIISRNEFFIKENQSLSQSKDVRGKNISNDITLKWHLSDRSKKITVTTDTIYKGCSIGLTKKGQDSEMKLITMVPKIKNVLIWNANDSGECRINYNISSEMVNTKNKKINIIYTLTDEF